MIKVTELQSPSLDRAMEAHEFWTELAIMEFSRGVRELLRRKGVRQRELAERLGCSEAYISKALGKENITIGQMQRLLHPLGAAVHIVVADRRYRVLCREMAAESDTREIQGAWSGLDDLHIARGVSGSRRDMSTETVA